MKKTKNKNNWFKIVAIALIAVLFFGIVIVFSIISSKYNNAYKPVDIVEREETYVMPNYPQLDETPSQSETDETIPLPEETEPTQTETGAVEPDETESTPPETDAPERKPSETDSSELEAPPSEVPPDTEAPTAAPPSTQKTETENPVIWVPETAKPFTPPAVPGKWSVYIRDPIYRVKKIDSNVVNILLIGVDTRYPGIDPGKSDTMLVVSYNKSTGELKLISLLRDSLVPIENHDWNRLNMAYLFGGVGMTINTINQLFSLDIQHYAAVDMNGLKELLAKIGPLELSLTQGEADYINQWSSTHYSAGLNQLAPGDVLNHVRNRTVGTDFGRTDRQRQVLIAVFRKVLKEKTLDETLDLLEYGTTVVGTNIDMVTMVSLVTQVVTQKNKLKIDTYSVPFSDSFTNAWYKGMDILSFDIQEAGRRIREIIY